MLDSREDIIEKLKVNSEEISAYAIKSIGLFGSFSRDESTVNSDIDLLVTFKEGRKTFRNFMGLKIFLQDILQREVDIVSADNVREELKPYIMKEIIYVEGL